MFFTQKRLKSYLAALLVLQILTFITGSSLVRTNFIDFRTFYTAGYMVRTGHAAQLSDYDTEQRFQNQLVSREDRALPMMSPPCTALLFVPLSFLSFRAAYLAFLLLNLSLLLLSATLIAPHLSALRDRWPPAPYLLWLAFLPSAIALLMGQLSLIVLLLSCLCFRALHLGKPVLAGLCLSLALIKFQIALPAALLFLCWRQWRFSAGFLAGASALTALSAAIISPNNLPVYLASLFTMTTSITPDPTLQSRFAILPAQMPNLYGLFFTLAHGSRLAVPLTLAASLAVFLWVAIRPPSLLRALCVAVLVSYHLFLYDLAVLILPASLIFDRFLLQEAAPERPPQNIAPALLHWIPFAATAALLLAPIERLLIAANAICLLSIPVLLLTLFDRHLTRDPRRAPCLRRLHRPGCVGRKPVTPQPPPNPRQSSKFS